MKIDILDETDPITILNRIAKRLLRVNTKLQPRNLEGLSLLLIIRRLVLGGSFTEDERLFFHLKRKAEISKRNLQEDFEFAERHGE